MAKTSAASQSVRRDPEAAPEPEEETEDMGSTDADDDGDDDDDDESALPATNVSPSAPSTSAPTPAPARNPAWLTNLTGVVRYRLLIHDNPVDPAQAFRCYASCRQAPSEAVYLECLSQCPGFEVQAGARCGPDEGIPNSVCIVRGPPSPRNEPTPGAVVAAVLLNVVVLFGLASFCTSSPSQCGFGYGYRPYSRY